MRKLFAAFAILVAWPTMLGAQVVGERIIGGHDAAAESWPYQAYIQIQLGSGQAACGGTLIAPKWVLTAAHCVVNGKPGAVLGAEAFRVRLGSLRRLDGGELLSVVRVIAHKDFGAGHSLENDIALLELQTPTRQKPVALESVGSSRLASDATPWAKVVGWGLTSTVNHTVADTLQEAAIPLVDTDRCNRTMGALFPDAGPIDVRRVCAGSSEGGVDSCNGDSGGPLLVSDGRGGWVQVGIVSFGVKECGKPGTYGVYTRVSAFRDWIIANAGVGGEPNTSTAAQSVPPIALGATGTAPGILASAASEQTPIRVTMSKRRLQLGEAFSIDVASQFSGHLLLFDLNSDNELTQIFPNPRSMLANKDGAIRAGASLHLPDASYGFALKASEPRGRGRLLAIVASDMQALTAFSGPGGFRAVSDPAQSLQRLELVLKKSTPTGRWAAAMTDYIVE